jgi:quercetin dioxygenase-like cupin family protein
MNTHRVLDWSQLDTDHPMDLIDRQRIVGEKMMISRVVLHPGFTVPEHHHESEQFVVMLTGKARFRVGPAGGVADEEVLLEGGQVLALPSNVPHACEAIEECVILDLFSPVSEGTGVDAPRKN